MRPIKHLCFLAYFVSALTLYAQDMPSKEDLTLPTKGICAHRGAIETHPENTISAFKEAIRLGAQMIEFDVQLTKDNALVIMHDTSVNRTTNGEGLVNNLTLYELKELDAGSWKSKKFAGEKIPTLKETLKVMPPNIWLNIHLKGSKKLGIKVAELIVSEKKIHQAIIASEKKAARGVRSIDREIKICNMERLSSRAKYIDRTIKKGYDFIQLKKSRASGSLANDTKKLKKHNITINYVKAETPQEIDKLLESGINFILTDHLSTMLTAFFNSPTIEK